MNELTTGVYYGFGPKSLSARIIKRMLLPIGVLLIAAILLIVGGSTFLPVVTQIGHGGIFIAIVLGIIQVILAYMDHLGAKFMISDNALYIRSGIFNRRE